MGTTTTNIFETMTDTRKNTKNIWIRTIDADVWRIPTPALLQGLRLLYLAGLERAYK
jgi:hypothetical protein